MLADRQTPPRNVWQLYNFGSKLNLQLTLSHRGENDIQHPSRILSLEGGITLNRITRKLLSDRSQQTSEAMRQTATHETVLEVHPKAGKEGGSNAARGLDR